MVLHIDADRANGWSNEEVAERWMQLPNGHLFVSRWLENRAGCDKATVKKVEETIAGWRERLCSISWFMRGVGGSSARMANEEHCKGVLQNASLRLPFGPPQGVQRHSECFCGMAAKSEALLDDAALLSCMDYVDLNPIRAGLHGDAVTSDFTSVQQRLIDYAKQKR